MKLCLFVFVMAFFTGGILHESLAAPLELITAKEAAQPNLSLSKGDMAKDGSGLHGRSQAPGAPQIIVEKPAQGTAVATPFPVRVRFIASPGAKINLGSLKIDVLKLIRISLLSRVKPYLTEKGINVPEAKVPPGTYNVEIAIADDQNRIGSTIQQWIVH